VLLGRGAGVSVKGTAELPPLHYAVLDGNFETVHELLDRDVDVNVKNTRESSLLHEAASYGHSKAVQELLARGANKMPWRMMVQPRLIVLLAKTIQVLQKCSRIMVSTKASRIMTKDATT
jgi:ankyrin repeat protein